MENNQQQQPAWVNNGVANEIVYNVKQDMARGVTNSKNMRKMMDLISGVENYRIDNHSKQGVIRKIYDRERHAQMNYRGSLSSNFGLDLDDAISVFWETVFKYLPRAETTGAMVAVRLVNGQQGQGAVSNLLSRNGIQMAHRPTKCNPVNYLKHMGVTGIRNMLNKSYRKNIMQVCDDCGTQASIMTIEAKADNCPSCKSTRTEKHWPSGHSSYKAKKFRRCQDCEHTWEREFVRACYKCGSENVHTDAMVINQEDTLFQQPAELDTAEETMIASEVESEMDKLLDAIYLSLPTDPKNPTATTRTHDVFNLLTRVEASADMCRKCVFAAPKVCEVKCATFKKMRMCEHDLIPDPAISCGGESMVTSKCVNYSKKIGEYHNVSASLASRRVKKVRLYVGRYVQANKNHPSYDTLHKLLIKHDLL